MKKARQHKKENETPFSVKQGCNLFFTKNMK